MSENIKKFLSDHGLYLEDLLGVKEWGLKREDALKLIRIMAEEKKPCLGGDVLVVNDKGKLRYTYDHWYIEKSKDDTDEEYTTKSILKAESYISNYKEDEYKKYYYVFV